MTRAIRRMILAREWQLAIGPGTASTSQLLLITVIGIVILHVCYRAATPDHWFSRGNTREKMDPEAVKKRTEQWSEEATVNPAFPPGQGPNSNIDNRNKTPPSTPEDGNPSNNGRRDGQQENQSGVDVSKWEFNWKIETETDFRDIGGMSDLKKKLRNEVIKPLENPEKAEKLGVSAPNIVFHGPPGTGKTYTAEALATELDLPYASLSGADVQSKWINESATKVNRLFDEAQEMAAREGGAIVFLDELDSVLKNRSDGGSAHEEDNKVVNEFLNHLEDTKDHGIMFIGATNRLDALDNAGIRSGRIDLKIEIGKPDVEARGEILRAQLADREHEISDTGIEELAAATDGAVAADLELLVNRAAKHVLMRDGEAIQWTDITRVKC